MVGVIFKVTGSVSAVGGKLGSFDRKGRHGRRVDCLLLFCRELSSYSKSAGLGCN